VEEDVLGEENLKKVPHKLCRNFRKKRSCREKVRREERPQKGEKIKSHKTIA